MRASASTNGQVKGLPAPGIRVLHVEDDPGFAVLVHRALRKPGPRHFSLVHEKRLDRALARIELDDWDLLLLDLGLPDGSFDFTLGTACVLARHLPVVVLTSAEGRHNTAAAGQSGTCRYLIKHRVDWRVLPETLRRAVVDHRRRGT